MAKSEEDGQNKLAIVGTDMVDAAFVEANKDNQNAINLEKQPIDAKLLYPDWVFHKSVMKLDYDEFNSIFTLLMSNLELITIPVVHRNTLQF